MSDRTTSGNYYRITSLRGQGERKAGCGMSYDDYSEESGKRHVCHSIYHVRFPSDNVEPEDLNGECIIVQAGNKKAQE